MSKNTSPTTLVMKFGGTSVGSRNAIEQVIKNVRKTRQEWERVVVVTSAVAGVTNLLVESAERAIVGDEVFISQAEKELLAKHFEMAEKLIHSIAQQAQLKQEIKYLSKEFSSICRAISILGEATPRALDAVVSLGERFSVRLLAGALQSAGLPAQYVEATNIVVTDDDFQSALPNLEKTAKNVQNTLMRMLMQRQIPVLTGFIGATEEGITTTLGRGGGDYSAAIIGATLPADEVWIWTDVSGVMTADPRLVPEARSIPELNYREMAELSYFGAKVLHPKAVRPVVEAKIPIRICNTFKPEEKGTRVINENDKAGKKADARQIVKAVTAIPRQRLITVEGRGMLGVPGVAARTFGAVASTGTSVQLITQASSEQSISFSVPDEASESVIASLYEAFSEELSQRDIDRVWASEEVAIITTVGRGLQDTPGVAGTIFSALGAANVNIYAIAQGSSKVSISFIVSAEDAEKAVHTLHHFVAAS
ncbi:MAG: aspartate kinase [Anaerolineae bacterium]|jgi:bifunctional aspartokinase / homoserine dehydrogenase 1|nr:aspartate kinase [Anaerolineae bacterium]MBT4310165.1 aspartate kinase [Anaerolineae bacterium]MBT4457200.1 aspartate kinase [Anaerolineae bacterium]MBT4842760.1 aspartate kinase [Anaerolineae bacterium]MBT6060992.1 aspartate kinase [Anaerolineae bacterium]